VTLKILRIKDVCKKIGLSRSTIYELIGEGLFPKSVKLTPRRVGWIESEIDDWIRNKTINRDYASGSSTALSL
jgi:prophage regulatory protein